MAIGTSDGKYYEDEFEHAVEGTKLAMEVKRSPSEQQVPGGSPRGGEVAGGGAWTTERVDQVKELAGKGLTPMEIGKELGITKGSVIGKMYREGIPIESGRSFGGSGYGPPAVTPTNPESPRNTPTLPKLKFMEGPGPEDIKNQAGLIDWLMGKKSDLSTKTVDQEPRSKNWPTDQDIQSSERSNLPYGDPSASAFDPRFWNISTIEQKDVLNWYNEGKNNPNVKSRPMDQEQADEIHKQWLASERSPISKLGFSPGKILQTKEASVNLLGFYDPRVDRMWYDPDYRSTAIHESMHRGFQMLRKENLLTSAIRDYPEEHLVRALMMRHFGDVEIEDNERVAGRKSDPESRGYKQIEAAKQIPAKVLDELERIASEHVANKRPRGPR